jgi:pyridine nucleotide-disulfide oxidoreductase family protein
MHQRLLLIGGGHAQLSVLRALARARPPGLETILVTPSVWQIYSGMLPGWMAGHYAAEQCRIDLRPWCEKAQVHLVEDAVCALDAHQRCVTTEGGRRLEYDLTSIDVGGVPKTTPLAAAGDRLLPIKPLERFVAAWPHVLERARSTPDFRLVVVGAGATGVELALAAGYAFRTQGTRAEVWLVAGSSGILPGHAPGVRQRAARQLQRAGVTVQLQRAAGHPQGVQLASGEIVQAHVVLAAPGTGAPSWLLASGLLLDTEGFILVDAHHRSISHPEVFAAGDVCSREDTPLARSGVHAVRAGPVLARNLMAVLSNRPLTTYTPRRRSLYLLACGDRYAIVSWGRVSLEGRWAWRWKDWIDRRFIARFAGNGKSA